MINLLGHIVFASAFTLCLKWVQVRRREDIVTAGAINYITAAVLSFANFYPQTKSQTIDTAAVLTGAAMGACYFTAYFFVIYLIKWVGAASSAVVGSLSILIPIAVAALVWQETPNAWQWAGIGLAIASLSLIGTSKSPTNATQTTAAQKPNAPIDPATKRAKNVVLVLLGFFVIAGSSRLAQRAFGHLSTEEHRSTFLFSAFAVAGTASLILLVARRRMPRAAECSIGLALGATNIVHTRLLMKSLDQNPGYIVFPIASAGALIFTTIVASQFLGERNSPRTVLGISIAVVALVLLNVNV